MKKVLITGASSGIGLATAEKMVDEGYAVTGLARNFSPDVEQIMTCVRVDLADIDGLPQRLADLGAQEDYSVLILSAGTGKFGGLEQFSHQQIRHTIDLNLISNLFLVKHFLPAFKKQGGKDIVIIGSESALQGAKQGSVYCASKFALRGLAQSLRADCANSDVRVMLVNPGPVDTDFFADLHFKPKEGADYSIAPSEIASAIFNALQMPRNTVQDEISIQPIKRAFETVKP